MGLLSEILKNVAGGTLTTDNHNQLFATVVGMLTNSQTGGLPGLLEAFKNKGLGEIAGSWVKTGPNLPVSPSQIQQVLGKGQIQQVAQKMGLSTTDAADAVSKLLPEVVDKLTPKGNIEPSDLLGEGLQVLKGFFS